MSIRVAIQGVAGCFHDAAAREYFAGQELDIAIENTIAGSLLPNHELLRQSDLTVIGEHKKYISHCICALPGQTIDDIVEVNSHPIALRQCETYLRRHPAMKVVETSDTAGSAKMIAERALAGHAAVCGRYAAELYGLQVLEDDIQTNKRNFTRFLIVAHPATATEFSTGEVINKASLAFTLPHTNGSLSAVLTIFSFYGLNLTKIQSLPIIGREWEYRFYIDLTFADAVRYRQSVNAVRPLINDFKILGEYASSEQ